MNIVVGYDGSENARRALERAAMLAGDGEVTVVAAVRVTPPIARGGGAAGEDPAEAARCERALDEAHAFLAEKGVRVRTVKGIGHPGGAIVAEAAARGADLVVVGSRGLTALERIVLGSVSTYVLHHAPCDVLVVG
jgi:nucleotide-binding universal stress UspA family protein